MRYFKENFLTLSHLPTWMMVIGFPLYWLEMFFHRQNHGITTPLAWILFAVVVITALVRASHSFDGTKIFAVLPSGKMQRVLIVTGIGLCVVILAVSLSASLLPPHLVQEEDVLNYHYTFPRQHLLRNSFEYISWSTCDLFSYEVQSALAPFWFATELPNKFPQFLFLVAVPFLAVRLLTFLGSPDFVKKILVVFAVLGAHHVGIQAGTAMLDIVLAYLFLAALDSLLRGNWILASVEFVFYFWSKSFIPLQMIVVGIALAVLIFVFKKLRFQVGLGFSPFSLNIGRVKKEILCKFLILFCVLSIFVAGPFLLKSLSVCGTPLYPFFVGVFPVFQNAAVQPSDWDVLVQAANADLLMKDAYGLPRTIFNFVKHFWLIAVPQEGVNNVFDYPLGLVYLLCIGPFIWFLCRGLLKKYIGIIPLFVVLVWMSWWFGSQQSRFLYVPLFLLYTTVIAEVRSLRIFFMMVLTALFFTSISVYRAYSPDFGKPVGTLLRMRDMSIIDLNKKYLFDDPQVIRIIDDYQVAYAQFPVQVSKEKLPYVVQINKE